jgi:hypothetical protein
MNAQTPTVTVDDVTVDESKPDGTATFVTFTVTRSGNPARKFSVDYTTADGTATAGDDYTAKSGTLTFAAGELTKTVNVQIMDNISWEPDETFSFNLSDPTGRAQIVDGQGQAAIKDNDPPPPPSTKYHQDDNQTASTVRMYGTDGVQDHFVFNSDNNEDNEFFSDEYAYIYGFKGGEDKIVIIDDDGTFVEQNIYNNGDYDNDRLFDDSYFSFHEELYGEYGSIVAGIVFDALIGPDDIHVTTDLNYGGLIWA